MNKYDIIIVGAGISGATIAERFANVLKKKVLLLDKRNHVAGNCYDYFNKDGILVHRYGPHFFHTNYQDVWKYVSKFSSWLNYEHRVLSNVDGKKKLVPMPVNLDTINILYNVGLKNGQEMKKWLGERIKKIKHPKNSEETSLSNIGKDLYEVLIKNYTYKQWKKWPVELDSSVIKRLPVHFNVDDRYFTDKYQGMPNKGYTLMFEKMLKSDKIDILLNKNYYKIKDSLPDHQFLVFTGPIDLFFNHRFGELEYRSLRFKYTTRNVRYIQEKAQINYPNNYKYTRILELKHATGQKHRKTTIIKEYSADQGEPYYPVPTERNRKIYERYQKEAKKLEQKGIYLLGRLANYKYINMDQAFKNALDFFKNYF